MNDPLRGYWFLRKSPLRRPYGTPNELVKSFYPTLKRGANQLCASGAIVRGVLMQSSIRPRRFCELHVRAEARTVH